MADVKISALPASGALSAGDLLAVVNGGVTSKATLSQIITGVTGSFVLKAGDVMTGALAIGTGSISLTQLGILRLSTNTTALGLAYFEQASGDSDPFDIIFRKARGTVTAPTVITVGDCCGIINFTGYSGAGGYVTGASIRADSSGTIASTRIPASLVFSTGTDNAPTVLTDAMTIDNAQKVSVGGTAVQHFTVVDEGTATTRGINMGQHNNGIQGSLFSFRKSRGTQAVPVAVASGDYGGFFQSNVYSPAGSYMSPTGFGFAVNGSVVGSNVPVDLFFFSGQTDSSNPLADGTIRMRVLSNGLVSFGDGSSSSYPALRRSSTSLQVRLADDSGFTQLDALVLTLATDVILARDAANALAQRNSTTAQIHRTYETFTDASNYSRSTLTTQAGNHLIRTEAAGTGTLRILQVGTGPSNGTDIAGVSAIFHGGQSTGTGLPGAILFQQSTPAGGTGSGVNALATRWSIATDGTFTAADAFNMAFGTTTGTKIGTATTQKIAFWNKAPIVQPTNAIAAAAFVANTSGIINDTATFGGYTIGQAIAALIATGILT